MPTAQYDTSKGVYLDPDLARRLGRSAWVQHTTAAALLREGMQEFIDMVDEGRDPSLVWGIDPPPSGTHHLNVRTTESAWEEFNHAAWRAGMVMSSAFRLVAERASATP